jgi:UPF0042 nucleotide-binding protein
MELLIISGLSGAGKSRAAAILEDMDFYCVDNMPVVLMPKFVELCLVTRGRYERVALVTDVRARENFEELFKALDEIREMGCDHKILFIEASIESIVKRYKETRRRHPLDQEGRDLEQAVQRENAMLMPVRVRADYIIDTSELTLGQLQRKLFKIFKEGHDDKAINIEVKSFGFKYGLPMEADLVFDVRFLPNPFYVNELRELSGLDGPVHDYIFKFEQTRKFMQYLSTMVEFLLPNYVEEGKHNLMICIGCTGGHHRSVAIAKALADTIAEKGYPVHCTHRDIEKAQ